ncbi:MAG TPA: glycerol-3-phosphate 1-O-acyltransferase PlsY [Rariglobus sp.]|jgi:glycerol-3-phosphate acyltransferase PlsY|nr:glycerol-3-phosphate 1-O-acyltransferase PlsY [Rariglobus sp.]
MLIPLTIAAIAGYFLGAIPFGYIVARAYGINIFEHGSKSPGATNVKRVLGKKAGNTVFALDAVKGAVAAGWPLVVFPAFSVGTIDIMYAAVTGLLFAVLGHSFSCFTRFKGGKGVATSAGGFIVLMPVVTLIALGVWLVTFYASRYVSLASILAAVAIPVGAIVLGKPPLLIGLAVLIGGFVIVLHRANIGRLLKGTENKFVKKPADGPSVNP